MKKMLVEYQDGKKLKFRLYESEAPVTVKELVASMPQEVKFLHARFNGEAIFFGADFVEVDLPEENQKPGAEMNTGQISMWRGAGGFKGKAVHFWYGPKVAGGNPENAFGEIEGDTRQLADLGISVWKEGPCKAKVSIVEE